MLNGNAGNATAHSVSFADKSSAFDHYSAGEAPVVFLPISCRLRVVCQDAFGVTAGSNLITDRPRGPQLNRPWLDRRQLLRLERRVHARQAIP